MSRHDAALNGHGVSMRCGGVKGAWTFIPEGLVHIVVGTVVAFGCAGWREDKDKIAAAAMFLEPETFEELELATFARLAVGASYRQAIGLGGDADLGDQDLSGPAAIFQLRFGWF